MLIYYSRNVVFMIITNSADINAYFFIHVISCNDYYKIYI